MIRDFNYFPSPNPPLISSVIRLKHGKKRKQVQSSKKKESRTKIRWISGLTMLPLIRFTCYSLFPSIFRYSLFYPYSSLFVKLFYYPKAIIESTSILRVNRSACISKTSNQFRHPGEGVTSALGLMCN